MLRELKEEAGLTVLGEPELFGINYPTYLGCNDYPIIYGVKDFSLNTNINSPEIEKRAWFDYGDLPEMISPGTTRRLNEYFEKSPQGDNW